MDCVSCDICVYHLRFVFFFFSGVFLHSRVTGACPVTTNLTTDLIMRVNVTTTTTTTCDHGLWLVACPEGRRG